MADEQQHDSVTDRAKMRAALEQMQVTHAQHTADDKASLSSMDSRLDAVEAYQREIRSMLRVGGVVLAVMAAAAVPVFNWVVRESLRDLLIEHEVIRVVRR